MKISTKGRYAIRIMLDMAEIGGEQYLSLKDIAERQEISVKYLEQIIATLLKSGYVVSMRGSNGGYKLAKAPEYYTIGDILRAAEGCLAPVECVMNGQDGCNRSETCAVHRFWTGLYDVVCDYVDSVTLADLMTKS